MPALADNISMWNESYDWSQQGDEWSDAWGGVAYQWWVTLFSRIQGFVPAGRILEIAPGYGRWTHFLRDLCDELVAVDIAETAIAHCRERFAGDRACRFHVNDGTSLAVAADRSVDLVFSFDSLVHAEHDIIAGYLAEFARVLADDGVAFIHHSNMGAYEPGSYDPHNIHWRATTVSAGARRGPRAVGGAALRQPGDGRLGQRDAAQRLLLGHRPRRLALGSRERRGHQHRLLAPRDGGRSAGCRALSAGAPDACVRRPRARRGTAGHTAALELAAGGDAASARSLLRDTLRAQLDPEALNDLAVLAHRCGDQDEAVALLNALILLHPEHAAAHENLAALREARP